MKASYLFPLATALIAVIPSVKAHGHITSWVVGGESKPGYTPYWPEEQGPTAERPTDNRDEGWADYWSPIVACGGMSAPNSVLTWDVDAGSTVTATWDEWDWGHRGPVLEYMAACPASGCSGVDAASLQWFKISQAGWDGKEFASETITRTLKWSFKIPSEIAPGNYLIRHEIIAMHRPNEPQVYPVCFQANVKSSGTLKPKDTVTFPAAYNMNDDFKWFNLYWGHDFNKFTPPGPAVFDRSVAAPAPPPPAPAPASSSSTSAAAAASSSSASAAASSSSASAAAAASSSSNTSSSIAGPAVQPTSTTLITSGAHATGTPPKCRRRPSKRMRIMQGHS